MDPRIGILVRDGRELHYAFAHGYDRPHVEGSRYEVETALGLHRRQRPSSRSAPALRPYVITLTWHGRMAESDEEFIVLARSHADALKQGREWKRATYGVTDSERLRCSYRARHAESWER